MLNLGKSGGKDLVWSSIRLATNPLHGLPLGLSAIVIYIIGMSFCTACF